MEIRKITIKSYFVVGYCTLLKIKVFDRALLTLGNNRVIVQILSLLRYADNLKTEHLQLITKTVQA